MVNVVCANACLAHGDACSESKCGRTMAMLDECHEQLNCLRTAVRAQADTCIVFHNHQSSRLGTPSRCRRPAVF